MDGSCRAVVLHIAGHTAGCTAGRTAGGTASSPTRSPAGSTAGSNRLQQLSGCAFYLGAHSIVPEGHNWQRGTLSQHWDLVAQYTTGTPAARQHAAKGAPYVVPSELQRGEDLVLVQRVGEEHRRPLADERVPQIERLERFVAVHQQRELLTDVVAHVVVVPAVPGQH